MSIAKRLTLDEFPVPRPSLFDGVCLRLAALEMTMKYVSIGQTGVHASLLALGAMTFGEKNVWKLGGLPQEAVDRIVRRAIDAGVNLFDTADVYDEGESEKALGKALKPFREQILLATKVRGRTGTGINEIGLSRHHIENGIRKSLERLQTSWADIYQFHSWDAHVPLEESLETMQDLVERGLVRYPGVSNFTGWQMSTLQARCEERGYSRYETAQMNYTLLNRDIEHEILPFMKFSKMTLLVWSPLHGGLLSGKYAKDSKPRSGTRAGDRGLFFPFFDETTGFGIVEKVKQVAEEQGATPAQIAISWLLSKKHVVLLGARNMEQFEEDLSAMDVNLTAEQLENLDRITRPRAQYPNWMIERQNSGRTFQIVEAS
jgi:aryl-alcohol dehydrogenase-like predicted oxidoreductase